MTLSGEPENPAFCVSQVNYSVHARVTCGWNHTSAQIFVLILCAPVVVYADIPAMPAKHNYRWCFENIGYPMPEKIKK